MKIGILTFPNSTSYGAALQMYALYHTVKKLGHDAEVINYHNPYMKAGKHTVKPGAKRSVRDAVRFRARALLHRRMEKNFRAFEKQSMTLFPEKRIVNRDKLRFADARYDAVICGSDQVWNPGITDSDMSYFLDFCGTETRRISYAPSFGVSHVSEAFAASAGRELQKFSAISVREQSGRALVAQMLSKDVPIVADPTMLLDAVDWTAVECEHPLGQGDYILYYTVVSSSRLWEFCRSLSRKTGMKIVWIGGNAVSKRKNRDPMIAYAVDVSPEEWLYLLHHARYVVTNSFHGTAFSINFRKDFYVEFSSATNSRLINITEMFGLQERVVENGTCAAAAGCDYTETEKKLPGMREDSIQFLQEALKEKNHG